MNSRPIPQPSYAAPKPGNTLVRDILPTLVRQIMFEVAHVDDKGNYDFLVPAESARLVFEHLGALEREQKIRAYDDITHKSQELFLAIIEGGHGRHWKLVSILLNLYFAELSQAPALAVICKIAIEQDELLKEQSPAMFDRLHAFHQQVFGLLGDARRDEIKRATERGRETPLEEPRGASEG